MGTFELDVFGTEDWEAIDHLLASACERALGLEVEGRAWVAVSVACVAGLVVDDGTTVVARAYQSNVTPAFLDGTIRVQQAARAVGLPAPEPLTPPIATEWGLVRFERELPDAGMRTFADHELDVSAGGLAELVDAVRDVDPTGLDQHPMAPTDALYPTPHSPIFDFEATAAGAEWIDEIAVVARAARDEDGSRTIAHGDWSARNVRISDGCVTAIYDWESCEWVQESSAVGIAAATWRSCGEPGEGPAPEAVELQGYVAAYEARRARPFTDVQRRAALGAAVYGLAYTARCEHSLAPTGREGRARGRLDRDGEVLVALLDR